MFSCSSKTRPAHVRSIRALVATVLAALVAVVLPALPAAAADTGVITSAGPLSSITISPDLNCDVRYASDTSPEFYGGNACGTLVAVGGVLYGPASIPAGSSASPRTPYTALSQTGPTGTGTSADPYKIVTSVNLGDSGLRLVETDSYVAGQENYRTDVSLTNGSGSAVSALVYRAGDCYLANSDFGLGQVTESSVACLSTGNRVEQWIPLTGGSHYYQANYNEVWSRIGSQQPFADSCRCSENIDNGAGLSWALTIGAGGTGRVSHLTAFSPTRAQSDRDGDGLLDEWEINGLDVNGDGSPDVDLPAMGASPDHKDLFVEADWMVRDRSCVLWIFCTAARSFAPNQAALGDVRAAMAAAPVANPDGTTGIRLHVDAGAGSVMNPVTGETWGARSRANNVGHVQSLGSFSGNDYDWTAFNALKGANFDNARRDVFHYALYADTYAGSGSSGIAQVTNSRFSGDAFMITDGDSSWGSGFSRRQEAGTFMHEFGHTLGLRHGGGDDGNNKPNYQTIMNYLWQLGGRPVDYSHAALGTLDEQSLAEQDGIPGADGVYGWYCSDGSRRAHTGAGGADWDCDGTVEGGRVAANLTGGNRQSGDPALTALTGFNDWSHLIYDGGAVGAFGADDLEDQDPPPTLTTADEATADTFRAARSYGQQGDGSLRGVGPSALYGGVDGQQLQIDVSNAGESDATFVIRASGSDAVAADTTVSVPGYQAKRFTVPVDGSKLRPGDITVGLSLTAVGSTEPLAIDSLSITVPDLTDPAVKAQADEALRQLPNVDGLDPAVKSGLIRATSAALGAGQLDRITLTPAQASTTAGQPARFAVTAIDGQGATIGDVTATAQLTATAPATCQAGACTATKPGTYRITATYQGKTAAADLVVSPGAPSAVTATAGDQQSVGTGQAFPTRLGVSVVDGYGNPVPNADVVFTVSSGSASFAGAATATVRSGSNGTAVAPTLTAGSEAGPVVVMASAGTATVGFLESVTAGGTGKADLKISLSGPSTARPGQEITVIAKVSNIGGGPASNVRTVMALPRGVTVTDAGGGTVRAGTLVLQSAPTLAVGQQVTYTVKAKIGSATPRWAWYGALTGSATKETNYRNNGAIGLISVR